MSSPAAPPVSTVLHALPAPPAGFIGRAEALDRLRAAASPPGTRALGLSGPPGAGKTALAVVAAQQLAPAYPDAQIYLDLADLGPTPTPGDVMAHVIWRFYPAAVLPEDPALLPKAYRSVVKDRRALLVIDGAPAQLPWASLAPPQGCLLLVGAAGLPVQFELALSALPLDDAVRLLLDLAPRIGPTAGELADLCGRLPLALRLAAGTLSTARELVTGSYLRLLANERRETPGADEALAALTVSARLLPEEAGRLWRRLAVFPASFDAPAAAAVAELKPEQAPSMLNHLLRHGLLESDHLPGRYRMHGLARQCAARWLEPAEREPAQRRHAAHFRSVLAAADRLVAADKAAAGAGASDGDGLLAGLRVFDLERANILAGQAWAAARVAEDPAAARLASDYAASGVRLLPYRQPQSGRSGWLETAREAAQQLGDRAAEGGHLDHLGRLYRRAADPRRAITVYERKLRLAREAGDRPGEGEAHSRLGLAYADLGQWKRALDYDRQALDIARELGSRRDEALASWNLGLALEQLDDLPGAIAAMQTCVDFEREISHPDAAADAAQVEALRRRAAR